MCPPEFEASVPPTWNWSLLDGDGMESFAALHGGGFLVHVNQPWLVRLDGLHRLGGPVLASAQRLGVHGRTCSARTGSQSNCWLTWLAMDSSS